MGEYLAFLSKTTIQKVCSNKMKQETILEKLGIKNCLHIVSGMYITFIWRIIHITK